MKTLFLTPKSITKIPIEAEIISPKTISGKSLEEVKELLVYQGNKRHRLTDFFTVEGEIAKNPEKVRIVIEDDIPHVKYIGAGMKTGEILIRGNAGMHTGSQMTGGKIIVKGNVSDWAGAEMNGGLLKIEGNAGHQLGSAYRGSSEGMTGGVIIVDGKTGSETAGFMRRGMLIIGGDTGAFTGVHMNGGEIFVFGKTGVRAGAQAKGNGGFIATLGGIEELLPTYRYDTTYSPIMMKLYLKEMTEKLGIKKASKFKDTHYLRYRGDLAVGGNSEILVAKG
jgi:formylmethanofuran dehydrogenase subunit C